MALEISYRPTRELVPYARNPRTHTKEQVDVIAKSITEFGWTNPVLVDGTNGIIAGHGRVLAAQKLGMRDVPCIELAHMSPAQRQAYVIADNQLALRAGWDMDLLKLEIEGLQALEFDLTPIGFEPGELARILAGSGTEGLTDPDEAPEPAQTPISTTGDLWAFGGHRLLCGDATNADNVAVVLGNAKPHLMVTDPPYGVDYSPEWRNERLRENGEPFGARAVGKVANDDNADWRIAWQLFSGDVAYVWHAGLRARQVVESLEASEFQMRAQIIWDKGRHVISRGHYHFRHEPCWYAVRKGQTAHWSGDRSQITVWLIEHRKSETGHGTQKPVECMKRPIENNSQTGDAVYDPFSGSGTTIIAAEMTGRRCYAIEIDPLYVDVAIKRWQAFTGKQATLDGVPFDEVARARSSSVRTD